MTVTAIYILAAALGIALFRALPLSRQLALLIADIGATLFVFLFSLLFRNASVYDPYWSVQPPLILAAVLVAEGVCLPSLLLLAAISLWALRLTANWAYTFVGFSYEDWRYRMLRESTGKFYPLINLIGIHMVPTLVVYLATLPAVAVAVEKPAFSLAAVPFFVLMICAVLLQGVSDMLMHRFRKHNIGGFIRIGTWKYSRHPNYLAEILMWWAVALYALVLLPGQYLLLVGAAANTCLFLFVSIPMADRRQARKEGFAAYRAETRMLLPIPKFRRSKRT